MHSSARTARQSWFLPVLVMMAAMLAGYLLRGWVDQRPAYTTFTECVLHEMKGQAKNLTGIASRFCREKVVAGEITDPKTPQ